jgi:hypothetical protein
MPARLLSALLRRTALWDRYQAARADRTYRRWAAMGRPVPPPHRVKQAIIRDYARRAGTRLLVETGTFRGDMIDAILTTFDRVVSIELDPQLFQAARARFRGEPRVTLLQGDSARLIPQVLTGISAPALFWLDGHYSGGETARGERSTPVREELLAVLRHPVEGHVILIDDARCFTGQDDYPTLPELQALVARERPDLSFSVADDVIRIHQPLGSDARR